MLKRDQQWLMFGITCLVMVGLFLMYLRWDEFSAGKQCVIQQESVLGIVDMKNEAELKRALQIKDEIGVQELIATEKVLPLQKGTGGLVLDSSMDFTSFGYYRRIRILSRAYYGKTVWIPNSVLYPGLAPASSK